MFLQSGDWDQVVGYIHWMTNDECYDFRRKMHWGILREKVVKKQLVIIIPSSPAQIQVYIKILI